MYERLIGGDRACVPQASLMNRPTEYRRLLDSRFTASRLGSIIDAAGAKSCPLGSVTQQAASSLPVTDPNDLVARALAIFSEEVAAWGARRAAKNSRGATPGTRAGRGRGAA